MPHHLLPNSFYYHLNFTLMMFLMWANVICFLYWYWSNSFSEDLLSAFNLRVMGDGIIYKIDLNLGASAFCWWWCIFLFMTACCLSGNVLTNKSQTYLLFFVAQQYDTNLQSFFDNRSVNEASEATEFAKYETCQMWQPHWLQGKYYPLNWCDYVNFWPSKFLAIFFE